MSSAVSERDLITYCGLYCGDCPGYKGAIADSAQDLKAELEQEDFKKAAQFFSQDPSMSFYEKYPAFIEVLGSLENLRCPLTPQACRAKAEQTCEVANCCREKGIEGCWECAGFEACDTLRLDILETLHGNKNIANLRILKEEGIETFLAGKRYWFGKEKKS